MDTQQGESMKIPDFFEPLEPRPWVEVRVDSEGAREEIRRRGWEYIPSGRRLVLKLEVVIGRNRFSVERFIDPRELFGFQALRLLRREYQLGLRAVLGAVVDGADEVSWSHTERTKC